MTEGAEPYPRLKEESSSWKVVYVASRTEKQVARRMEQAGIEHYVPLVKRLHQWSDRKKWVEVPLFNGYVFVRTPERLNDQVLQVSGVVAWVRYNGKPATVRNEELEAIRSMVAHGYDIQAEGLNTQTEPGTRVQVTQGPLKGFTGELLKREDETWFSVILETINQFIRVKLPAEVLKPIHD